MNKLPSPALRLVWSVAPAPTGRYRSFERRGWPSAEYSDGNMAATLYCDNDYAPLDVKTGNHSEITIRVADHSQTPWQWRTLKARGRTLKEAKEYAKYFLATHQEFQPNGGAK